MTRTSLIHIKEDYRKIKPTHKNILVTDMEFNERISHHGIILPNDDMKSVGIRPRWCRVVAVGHEQKDVKPNEYILVAHGRWTRGIDFTDAEGKTVTVRLVDPKDVLLSADELPHDTTVPETIS